MCLTSFAAAFLAFSACFWACLFPFSCLRLGFECLFFFSVSSFPISIPLCTKSAASLKRGKKCETRGCLEKQQRSFWTVQRRCILKSHTHLLLQSLQVHLSVCVVDCCWWTEDFNSWDLSGLQGHVMKHHSGEWWVILTPWSALIWTFCLPGVLVCVNGALTVWLSTDCSPKSPVHTHFACNVLFKHLFISFFLNSKKML